MTTEDHPFVRAVREHAERVLRPAALETDRCGVSAEQVAGLARLGLLNHAAPVELGGAGLGDAAERELHEILAGACFNTWLVWAQHAPLVGRLSRARPGATPGAASSELGGRVLRGEVLLGAGISDVRRFPDRHVAATRVAGGWRLDGVLSWVSGWGLHAALTVAAVEQLTGTVVTALVPVGDRMRARPLRLAAVTGSRTERVELDGVLVADEHVLGCVPLQEWRRADVDVTADAKPHHFGLAESVLRELDDTGQPAAVAVAASWRPRLASLRGEAYGLADGALAAAGAPYRVEERRALKIAGGEMVATLTRALLVARAGHGLVDDDTAQLHARSALFVQVQGQDDALREAHLARLARW